MNTSINLAQLTNHHLDALFGDPEALARLHVVARHQLRRKGLPLLDSGDLIGHAVQSVLRGPRSCRRGRLVNDNYSFRTRIAARIQEVGDYLSLPLIPNERFQTP